MEKVSRLLQNLSVVLLTVVMMFSLIVPSIATAAYENSIGIEWVYVKSDLDAGATDWSDPEVWMRIRYDVGTPDAYWSEWKGTRFQEDVPIGSYALQGEVLDFPCTDATFITIYVLVQDDDHLFDDAILNTDTGILNNGEAHAAITLTGTHADIKFNITDTWCEIQKGVGGIAELPEIAQTELETADPSATNYALFGGIAAGTTASAIILITTAWYARRRWLS